MKSDHDEYALCKATMYAQIAVVGEYECGVLSVVSENTFKQLKKCSLYHIIQKKVSIILSAVCYGCRT